MKQKLSIVMMLSAMMALTGCSANSNTTEDTTKKDTVAVADSAADKTQIKEKVKNETSSSTTTYSSTEEKDDEFDIDGQQIQAGTTDLSSTDGVVKITAAGTYELSGKGESIIVDAKKQDVTLVLNGVNLDSDRYPNIYVKKASNVTIELKGDNTMHMGSNVQYDTLNAAVYMKSDAVFKGDGSLTVNSEYKSGIKCKDTAEFESGTYKIQAENDGIRINDAGVFKNGDYTITTNGEGIESKDTLTIENGTYRINTKDDGINAANSIVINDGKIYAVSTSNDGIDSNGDLIINGGEVTAIAMKTPETAFDTDGTPFEINGGKVIGIGMTGNLPTSSAQPVIAAGINQKVESAEIRQNGNTVAKWDLSDLNVSSGQFLLLSDSALKQNETYEVYINGSLLQEVTLNQMTVQIGSQIRSMGGPGMGGMNGGMNGRPDMGNGERPDQPGMENGDMNFEEFNPGQRPSRNRGGWDYQSDSANQ